MSRTRSWVGLGLVGVLSACSRPRTEIVAVVDSELPWGPGATVQSVTVEVRQDTASGRLHSLRTTALGAGAARRALPLAVGLLPPEEESDAAVWIEVRGCPTPDGCALGAAVVVQRAVVRFVAEQTVALPMLLASACVGVTCGAEQRCEPTTGRCVAATSAQATVGAYNGPGTSVGADATVRADVWDGGASDDRPDAGGRMDAGDAGGPTGERPDVDVLDTGRDVSSNDQVDGTGSVSIDRPNGGFDGCVPNGMENTNTTCMDDVDNDCNGFSDCRDFSCSRNMAVTFCTDGGMGLSDTIPCVRTSAENTAVTCADGVDNDCDGFVDCRDLECRSFCHGDAATSDRLVPGDGGAPPPCGTERPTVSTVRGTEGLVIAANGTIYYSQSRAVGRIRPGMAPEPGWASLPAAASTVWGLAIDVANQRLYVGSPSAGVIYAVDLAAEAPMGTVYLVGAGAPNGLTMGPDGALYYSNFAATGHVYRVVGGMRTQVTTTAIRQPNGVAFHRDGSLYVDSYAAGELIKLTLVGNIESARRTIATTLGNPDGLAFDARDRIYVSDNSGGRLIRLDADGANPEVLRTGISAAANIEFGAGALPCTDVYVASGGGLVRYEMGDTNGASVPWH